MECQSCSGWGYLEDYPTYGSGDPMLKVACGDCLKGKILHWLVCCGLIR